MVNAPGTCNVWQAQRYVHITAKANGHPIQPVRNTERNSLRNGGVGTRWDIHLVTKSCGPSMHCKAVLGAGGAATHIGGGMTFVAAVNHGNGASGGFLRERRVCPTITDTRAVKDRW